MKTKNVIIIAFIIFIIETVFCCTEDNSEIEYDISYENTYILLKNGVLIDGNGGNPLNNAMVIFFNGIITYEGAYNENIIPDKAYIIDLKGKTILPGFIDAHVHSSFGTVTTDWSILSKKRYTEWLKGGVTTVRDLGMLGPRVRPLLDLLANTDSNSISRVLISGPALYAGVYDIAHPQLDKLVPDSTIACLIQHNTPVVSTLSVYLVSSMRQMAQMNLDKMNKSGVKIALGTDYDDFYVTETGMPLHEINLLLEAGLSPMDIIVAATKNAAAVCNLANDLGTIEQGKIADIIVVDGDPLTDLSVLKNKLTYVIHNGRIVDLKPSQIIDL